MKIACLLLAGLLWTTGCRRSDAVNSQVNLDDLKNIPQQQWDKLAQKKIFFGHQSVGFNILDGINDVMKAVPGIKLYVKETTALSDYNSPVFAHARVGKNMDPISKCVDFKRIMDSGIGDRVDIAGFKFCYIDIDRNTDINLLFNYYSESMDYLQKKYPNVRFFHCTVPLTSKETSITGRIRRFIGNSSWDDNNVRRNEFNKLMVNKFKDTNMLFDIGRLEASDEGNNLCTFSRDNTVCLVMNIKYTSDGGHLNETGRRLVGINLLKLLGA
jgi:hypothetical protein